MKLIRVIENPIYEFPCFALSSGRRSAEYKYIPLINIIADFNPVGLDAIIAGSDFQATDSLSEGRN